MKNVISDRTVTTQKIGAEDIIMMRLPAERFRNRIPQHYTPIMDSKSRYQVALLAQSCTHNSFDDEEAGPTSDLHFWLQVGSSNASTPVEGAEIMLPDMHWYSLASATSNAMARDYLCSFGFSPLALDKTDLRKEGGSIVFPDEGQIAWTITGPGKALPSVGVNHDVFVQADGPGAVGHHITALLSDTVMEQPCSIHIQTRAMEPFLQKGEQFAVIIHRMNRLEANVIWQQHPE